MHILTVWAVSFRYRSAAQKKEMQDTFSSFYILPSLYHSDLDRGFSVVDYNLNEELATIEDLSQLKELGIDLKLDFILNHASAQSPQFKDLVEKGDESEYRDFFIDWNKFWEGHGVMTDEGYIQPDESCLKQMFSESRGFRFSWWSFRMDEGCHTGTHFTRRCMAENIWGRWI